MCSESGGLVTEYKYDTLGNVTETKDSSGVVVTTNSYDTLGRKISTNDSDLGLWAYDYDPNGSLKTQTDPMGSVTKIEYDSLNRVKRKLFNDTEVLAYSYDSGNNAKGRRSKFSDKHQTTNYQYDSRGRLVLVEKSFAGKDLENLFGGSAYTTTFSYDNLDRQVAITYPSTDAFEPETVNLSFDGPYLKSVAGENVYVSDIAYNLFGQVIEKRLGNNVIESYAYDPLNQRLDSLSYNRGSSDIVSLQYAYSPVGNITKITDNLNYGDDNFSMTQNFNYDSFYRLISSTGTGFSTFYSYDDTDRMLKKTVGQDSYTYGYNQNFPYHAIKNINIGGVSQGTEYDQSGNLLSYRVGDLERDINWDYSIGKPGSISLIDYSVPDITPTPTTTPIPTATPTPTPTPTPLPYGRIRGFVWLDTNQDQSYISGYVPSSDSYQARLLEISDTSCDLCQQEINNLEDRSLNCVPACGATSDFVNCTFLDDFDCESFIVPVKCDPFENPDCFFITPAFEEKYRCRQTLQYNACKAVYEDPINPSDFSVSLSPSSGTCTEYDRPLPGRTYVCQEVDPGSTTVTLTGPEGYYFSTPATQDNVASRTVTVPNNNATANANFGLYSSSAPTVTPTPAETGPISTPVPLPGDANRDGIVDGGDFVIWLFNYGKSTQNGPSEGDFNIDQFVDGQDFVIWLFNYGSSVPPTPTPTSTPTPRTSTPTPTPTPTRTPIPTPTNTPIPTPTSTFCPGSPNTTYPNGDVSCGITSLTFQWENVPDATLYALRIDQDPDSWSGSCNSINPGDTCVTMANRSYTRPVIPGKTYKWWVHTINACGWSPSSTPVEFSVPLCPGITPTPINTPVPTPTPTGRIRPNGVTP